MIADVAPVLFDHPLELSDAARIDGAGEVQILLRVILPLVRPALAMVPLFQFMNSWGDYLGPLIYSVIHIYTVEVLVTSALQKRVVDVEIPQAVVQAVRPGHA